MPTAKSSLAYIESRREASFYCAIQFFAFQRPFGHLPGDLLLFFAGQEWWDDYYCEWQTIDKVGATGVTELGAPQGDVRCYGLRFRTCDYVPDCDQPEWAGIDVLHALKIGGLPCWLQGPMSTTGTFLCSLPFIQPRWDTPWPWTNQESALSADEAERISTLWLDMGMLYFFLEANNEVTMHFQSG